MVSRVWVLVVACVCVCAQTCAPIEALDETGRILCGAGGACPTGFSCRAARCCRMGVSSAACPQVSPGDPGWLCDGGACLGGACAMGMGATVGYCFRPDGMGSCGALGVTLHSNGLLPRDRRPLACLPRCPLDSPAIASTCTFVAPNLSRGGQCVPLAETSEPLVGACVLVCGDRLPPCPDGLSCQAIPMMTQRICAPSGLL